jgi:hypothetical protein
VGVSESWQKVKTDWIAGRRARAAIRIPFVILFAAVMVVVIAQLFTGSDLEAVDWRTRTIVGSVFLMQFLLAPVARAFVLDLRFWRARGRHVGTFPIGRVLVQSWMFLIVVGGYAHYAYPLFLPMYGGGRPALVHLVPAPGSEEVFKALSGDGASADSMNFNLIAETGDWLVLVRPQFGATAVGPKSAIRLRRDTVAAIEVVAPPNGP